MAERKITLEELSQHVKDTDTWMAINGTVWDITGFAELHPGGPDIIQEYSGGDASGPYNSVHSLKLAEKNFEASQKIGVLEAKCVDDKLPTENTRNPRLEKDLPDLDEIINLNDLEVVAEKCLNERSWAYFSGASNDSFTKLDNSEYYRKILLRPRVARAVRDVSTRTKILDDVYDTPIFNAPASLMMLAHPDAEMALAKGLAASGSTIIIPTLSSFSTEEIIEALPADHPFYFQLYVSPNEAALEKMIDTLCKIRPKAIMITADLPVFSKREANERYEKRIAKQKLASGPKVTTATEKQGGQARSAGVSIDPNLCWSNIKCLKERTGIPIFIKGIQCAEDAMQAWKIGCKGIYISNHGGRAADTAQPTILTLAEIRLHCPFILEEMEVIIDGGVRRGSDVLKAICLGAKGVCLGRPFFYALMYGEEGVRYIMQCEFKRPPAHFYFVQVFKPRLTAELLVLKDELETAMQLCGITSLSEAHIGLLNTKALYRDVETPGSLPSKL
jgi:L-lactate dehydrogenase (cytochrome)